MRKVSHLLLAVCAVAFLASCNSYKTVPYVIDAAELNTDSQSPSLYDAKIMPKDILTITVNTVDPKVSAPFNLVSQASANSTLTTNSTTQASLMQYLVGNDGTIDFPVLGKLTVVGLTKNECENMIRQRLSAYITNETPVVTVRMPNFSISVIGEVNRPGQFTVSKEKVNIFEALALAGDMTIYGVRSDVKLIREDASGKKVYHSLNLNEADIIFSPYYQLQQNDIVVVTPNKTKAKNSDIGQSTTLWFSFTSIIISLTSLLYNILK